MAINPVTGAKYPWYGDPVNAPNVGNGTIINIHGSDVVVLFERWEGWLDNKKWIRHLVSLDRSIFRGAWSSRYGGYWSLREQDVV
jgi:hypothetical protein